MYYSSLIKNVRAAYHCNYEQAAALIQIAQTKGIVEQDGPDHYRITEPEPHA